MILPGYSCPQCNCESLYSRSGKHLCVKCNTEMKKGFIGMQDLEMSQKKKGRRWMLMKQ